MKLVSPIDPDLAEVYRAEVDRGFARIARERAPALVTESDLDRHPPLVRQYLRRVGVVQKPRVRAMRARFQAEMKMSPDGGWMPASAVQTSFFDEPTRLFLMTASETVTMFNDLCFFAAPALVDANVRWEQIDARRVRGFFTNAGHTISAELAFDTNGDLVEFVSNDRSMTADGKTYERLPWVTPVGAYRDIAGFRLATRGEAIWKRPRGDHAYARMALVELSFATRADDRQTRSMIVAMP